MTLSDFEIGTIIALLGIGAFLIHFSFLGLIESRTMPR